MAILNEYYNEQFDLTIPNCYWKIDPERGIEGGKDKIKAKLCCYKNKDSADNDIDKYEEFHFEFIPDLQDGAVNIIKQAYLQVKTYPKFINSVDA